MKIEELKDYEFIYNNLNDKFAKLPEDRKLEFCRSLKESWSSPIREVYESIIKQFYEELALRSKTMEEINAERQALVIFLAFKKYIEGKISLFNQKVQPDASSSSALKNL